MQELCLKGSLSVDVDEIDSGYAWIHLEWQDALGYPARLDIDFDGWCSREMPVRSGQGPPHIEVVEESVIRFTFTPELARRLELAPEVRFEFKAHEKTLADLRRFLGEPEDAG